MWHRRGKIFGLIKNVRLSNKPELLSEHLKIISSLLWFLGVLIGGTEMSSYDDLRI